MHLLLKPLVRLLARFNWNIKFLIFGLVAALIMAALVVMSSAGERAALNATRDEVRGLDVFEPTLQLLVLMQQHRGLSSGALGGDSAMRAATDKKTEEIDATFQHVDAVTRAAPGSWGIDAPLQKMRAQWNTLRDSGMRMQAAANFEAHTDLVNGLMAQINLLGDESGLILDPESETYHGIIAIMAYMPQVTEQLGQMRGLGSGILAQKHISDEQRIKLAGLSGSLKLSYGFLHHALDNAVRHKTRYAATVTTLLDGMDQQINESIMLAESEVMSSNFGVTAQDYFDTLSKPVNLLVSTTTQKLLPTLRDQLDARETRSQRDLALIVSLSVLGAFLLLIGFAALHSSLRGALDALIVGTRTLASGDFRHRIAIDTQDETAELAHHFNDMSMQVSAALGTVIRDARRVHEAAMEMSRLSVSVRGQAQQQSDSASTIAAAVEETAVSMGEISRNATETESASSEAQREASEGSALVERVAGGMEHIAEVIDSSAHLVRVLGERSAEINRLTATIREIADQTNLLALNAAIEAARAGESGRGFAVVADEVRKLAERTSTASNEIVQTVRAIQNGTDEAAQALETGVNQVHDGVARSRDAGHLMDSIRGSSERVLGAVSDIGLALREQRTANEDVARNVEAIARMAEAAAHDVGQAADTAARLQDMADELQRSVARFSVD